ncbi:ABC transporter ATP-binding protein [Campylobacter hominis]|uniref:ABC transporter, ATP-binding protein n=1 Tax=Campylobacter hominis (strain ATCC BAA-381 / DSM 21671 / CCUG 45161 / LMG 19568 / NCTC 13146 / CH001A) TaxID=360107 RepID=A7I0Q9_CAMHC|nr:ABC transporter ATP-binding protein [Campylobacter hominis]ABS52427.1 ABC transporter, ATP-binding protein [Campylobacter hominis ATCC BAA-381]UAK85076.1 ABC transporter ATP-binding protein [Campylobacter hominis]SUW84645.1 ABC transporter, ATP-binding protein [Campylobacter hominis]
MIELKNVTKIFNENKPNEFIAVKDISFSVKKGEIFILNGVSGSGKTTVLSMIAGLYKPSAGEIIVKNESINKLSLKFMSLFRRENIGFIFQNFNLIPTLSVFENIILPALPCKILPLQRADELLDEFNLKNKKNELAKNLSGGEMQRVAIIRALINDADIILADEPTANLDAFLSQKFVEILKFLQNKGKTIVISTHDPFLIENSCVNSVFRLTK